MAVINVLHGDISNQVGDTIAFQVIDTLLHFRTEHLKDKFLNALYGKEKRAMVRQEVLQTMEHIYRNTEMCIDLVLFRKDFTEELEEFLEESIPFNRLLVVDKPSQIGIRLITSDIAYYVDDNSEVRSLLNSPYAISFDELPNYISMKKR